MNRKGDCSYNEHYRTQFPWSEAVPQDPGSACCKLCKPKRAFKINTMGRQAFISHAAGNKHKEAIKAQESSLRATSFFQPMQTKQPMRTTGAGITTAVSLGQNDHNKKGFAPVCVDDPLRSQRLPEEPTATSSAPSMPVLKKFMLNDSVAKAEILWCLQAVSKHTSNRSAAESVLLFTRMFPDSEIAAKMQLQKDKIGYTVVYGLAPYFQRDLRDRLGKCDFIAVGFDESLNDISKKKQMDVIVRFWDVDTDMVSTRYLSSVFLQKATSSDLKDGLKNAVGENLEKRVIQVSMDGPPVNFKMLRELQTELKEMHGTSLVDLGSCGLHVVHGAFKFGMKSVPWELSEFLTSLYYLFKDSPARRGHFTRVTASDIFPMSFCFTRWVENAKVGSRALLMLPHLQRWVGEVHGEGIGNDLNKGHKHFDRVAKAIEDPLLPPKLAFFVSTAEMVEPFLTSFQSSKPMVPLLFRELQSLTLAFMERVVKKSALEDATKIIHVDMKKEENLLPAKNIDLGFGTRAAIRGISQKGQKLSDADALGFRADCRNIYIAFISKIQERSPLKYKFTRSISCLDPAVVVETPNLAKGRIDTALDILLTHQNLISAAKAERIKRSYSALINVPTVIDALKSFSYKQMRLDTFWAGLINTAPSYISEKEDLMGFVKMGLILFHGNAALERSFSINADCVIENQKEESLVGIRVVQDAVTVAGGVLQMEISKGMIQAARNAYSLYKESREKRKQEEKACAEKEAERKRVANELKNLENKKQKLLLDAQMAAANIDEQIKSLKK